MTQLVELKREELVDLAAVDSEFYCRQFFPQTVRQPFAPFHHDAWEKLESEARLVNLLMFRGSGKTSHCRLYTSKSIAYGMSRTILYTGKSEGHALRSTSWIKKNVENNRHWTETFGIRPGSKWQDTEFEIIVGQEEISIWVMAAGITGSIRGLNRDDYRPDLIVLDDVLDDENAHTLEQREKIKNLVYGALMESLAPKSEAPHAKMVGLNTPQNKGDFAVEALKDPGWLSAVYGCFTKDTRNLPVEYQESSWPERFSSEELRKEKHSAAARNMLSVFLREKECKLISSETASFRVPWLKKYSQHPEPIVTVYAIDPVPPPSDVALAKGLANNDFEAHVVWGAAGDKRFLLDYALMRGHEPTWSIKTFFEMQMRWRPIKTLVESVAYQRTLAWLLRKAMDQRRQWYAVEELIDRRKKYNRIITAHNGLAAAGRMYIRHDHTDFLEQFGQYPQSQHDDLLDASSMALSALEGMFVGEDGTMMAVSDMADDPVGKFIDVQVAP
jgi:phage terminase large subunit-like protein